MKAHKDGYLIARRVLKLAEVEKYPMLGRSYMAYSSFVLHHQLDLAKSLKYLNQGYEYCMDEGDYEYAAYCLGLEIVHRYYLCDDLIKLKTRAKSYLKEMRQTRQYQCLDYTRILSQYVDVLSSDNLVIELDGNYFSERIDLKELSPDRQGTALFVYYQHKLQLCVSGKRIMKKLYIILKRQNMFCLVLSARFKCLIIIIFQA